MSIGPSSESVLPWSRRIYCLCESPSAQRPVRLCPNQRCATVRPAVVSRCCGSCRLCEVQFAFALGNHPRVRRDRDARVSGRFHRVVNAQEGPKTSFTATPKRIFKSLGRLIDSFSHFFQFISLDVCGQSTFRTCDFRILLEIGNFNLRRIAANLAFDWELNVTKGIRFHFCKTFNTW